MDKTNKNVIVLAACQALLLTNNITLIALNGLIGYALASDKSLATLPLSTYVIGAAISTIPASLWMRRVGRRAGFMTGASFGLLGTALATFAVYRDSFWLLCVATLAIGVYNAFGQYYRFAAADTASEDFKSRAISLVLAGGIVGGVLGPQMSTFTRSLLPVDFLGTYVALMGVSVLSLVLLLFVDIPPLPAAERSNSGRPLPVIMRQPVFIVAALAGMVGYGMMNLIMTATPLAMVGHSHHFNDAAFVLEWHVIGMFAPSFFTGSLIRRYGVLNIMLVGAGLVFACIATAVSGTGLPQFWVALVLLGIGWNFLFVGGTTLLTESYSPAERAKTQAANDFLVFGTMMISSLMSGALLHHSGWTAVNLLAVPFLSVTVLAVLWLAVQRRRAAASAG